uniref:Uncharacterized protein n=1 Tax=Panagrolaimus sp. ES5 TaxID=591445 RepID=A0AC34GT03_9BILA
MDKQNENENSAPDTVNSAQASIINESTDIFENEQNYNSVDNAETLEKLNNENEKLAETKEKTPQPDELLNDDAAKNGTRKRQREEDDEEETLQVTPKKTKDSDTRDNV